MCRRINRIPGITRNQPTFRSLTFEWIKIFRFSGEQSENQFAVKKLPEFALTRKFRKVSAESYIIDGFRICCGQCLNFCSRVNFEKRRPLFSYEFDIGAQRLQYLFESRHSIFTVCVVWSNGCPAFCRIFCGLFSKHSGLHIS